MFTTSHGTWSVLFAHPRLVYEWKTPLWFWDVY